jgi:hypothetical protein
MGYVRDIVKAIGTCLCLATIPTAIAIAMYRYWPLPGPFTHRLGRYAVYEPWLNAWLWIAGILWVLVTPLWLNMVYRDRNPLTIGDARQAIEDCERHLPSAEDISRCTVDGCGRWPCKPYRRGRRVVRRIRKHPEDVFGGPLRQMAEDATT